MIVWRHTDGSSTTVDETTTDGQLLRVLREALRSIRGQYPSINSVETIEEILDFVDEIET